MINYNAIIMPAHVIYHAHPAILSCRYQLQNLNHNAQTKMQYSTRRGRLALGYVRSTAHYLRPQKPQIAWQLHNEHKIKPKNKSSYYTRVTIRISVKVDTKVIYIRGHV